MPPEELEIVLRVTRLLDELSVAHHLGGSFASSIHGVPRQTRDADIVADLPVLVVERFVHALQDEFYVDEPMILDAITHRSCFNLIHLDSGFKVDIFVVGTRPFDRSELERAQPMQIRADPSSTIHVKTAEDLILRKLEWYLLGGRVSDRQWGDIQGILLAQGESLDHAYLHQWAPSLGVADLLAEAIGLSRR